MTTVYVCPNKRCRQRSMVAGYCSHCARRGNHVRLREEGEEPLSRLAEVSADDVPRLPIPCWPEVENALHGGFVLGTVMGLYGEPGIGKSTLALHLADALAAMNPTAYLSTEQLVPQVKLTAVRIGIPESHVLVGYQESVEEIEETLDVSPIRFCVVDSLQGCCERGEEISAAKRLTHAARRRGIAMLLVLHTTKDGDYSGPRAVEHEIDGMLSLTSNGAGLTLTVESKYRYGPVGRRAQIGRSESGRLWDLTYGPF